MFWTRHLIFTMSLAQDVLVSIVRKLPVKEQFRATLELLEAEHAFEFVDKAIYLDSLTTKLQQDADTLTSFMDKRGIDTRSEYHYLYKWDTKCDIEILGFDEGDIPSKAIHKIEIWQDMYKRGLVGPYHLIVTNYISHMIVDDEEVRVTMVIRSTSADEVMVTLDVMAQDYHLATIAAGTRHIKNVKISELGTRSFVLTEGQPIFVSRRESNEFAAMYPCGTMVRYSNSLGREFDKYTFSVSAENILKLLF